DDVPAFQHEHLPLGSREVARGHEAVVAPADDDRVVRLGHPPLLNAFACSTCGAARRRARAGDVEAVTLRRVDTFPYRRPTLGRASRLKSPERKKLGETCTRESAF